MEILLKSVFVFSITVVIFNLLYLATIPTKRVINWPEICKVGPGHRWILYPSALYQVYYWSTYLELI